MAVKIMQSVGLGDEAQLDAFRREVQVLSALRHPHIVRLLGACLVLPHLCIVEELAMGGSLYDMLHGPPGNRRDCPLPYPQVKSMRLIPSRSGSCLASYDLCRFASHAANLRQAAWEACNNPLRGPLFAAEAVFTSCIDPVHAHDPKIVHRGAMYSVQCLS